MKQRDRAQIQNITPEFLSMIKLPEETGKILNYLIIMPRQTKNEDEAYIFPIGIPCVSAALKASGRSVFTLNITYEQNPEELVKKIIANSDIDVVLTGGNYTMYADIVMIINTAKEVKPDIVTVVGGPIITGDPVAAMDALENADVGVIGEGEITVNALAYALETNSNPAEVDGIIYRINGKYHIREQWVSIPDIDILPFPDYVGFAAETMLRKTDISYMSKRISIDSTRVFAIVPTRSCPYKCTFCFHACGTDYRIMSIDRIFRELDWLLAVYPDVDSIYFGGEQTIIDEESCAEFCHRIEPYKLQWRCTARANILTREMLQQMKDSGCVNVCIGIESADNRILRSMRKGTTVEQIDKVLNLVSETGINMGGFLIFGDPEETMETVMNSLNWKQSHPEHNIFLQLITQWPGTELYKIACERGIIKDRVQFLKDGCWPVNISKLTDDEYNLLPILFDIFNTKSKPIYADVKPRSDRTVSVTWQCPKCSKTISIMDHDYVIDTKARRCPVCRKVIYINPIEYCDFEHMQENAESLITESRGVAIWAVNANNYYWLFKAMPVLKADNVWFINSNDIVVPHYGKTVKTLEGKTVYTPDIINREEIDTVIIPNNLNIYKEIKAECEIKYPQVKRIVHITELM